MGDFEAALADPTFGGKPGCPLPVKWVNIHSRIFRHHNKNTLLPPASVSIFEASQVKNLDHAVTKWPQPIQLLEYQILWDGGLI